MNWELPFKRIGWPKMPPVKEPRTVAYGVVCNPIYERIKPRLRKFSDGTWFCENSGAAPPGSTYIPFCVGVTPRYAYLQWWAYCATVRMPGRPDLYHPWTKWCNP